MRRLLAVVTFFAAITVPSGSAAGQEVPRLAEVLDLPVERTYPDGATYTPGLAGAEVEIMALLSTGEVVDVLRAGHSMLVGPVGSIAVPPCLTWWIEPDRAELTDRYLTALADEMRAQSVPGLSLRRFTGGPCIIVERPGDISGAGLKALADVPSLVWLSLRHTGIDDEGLRHLIGLKNLRHLDLSFCKNVTSAGMAHVAKITSLRSVDLDFSGVTAEGLRALESLPDLRGLSFHNEDALTDEALSQFTEIERLIDLDIGGTKISDAGIAELSGLKRLRRLRISDCGALKGTAFSQLATLKRLEECEVGFCFELAEESFKHFAAWPALQRLSLSMQVTDAGLRHLAQVRQLRSLTISHSKITDRGVMQLKDLSLNELRLHGCRSVTKDGVEALRRAVPQCEITLTVAYP